MERVFGLKNYKRIRIENRLMEVALFNIGDMILEYLSPLSNDAPLNNFINKHGEGFHHVAYLVDSIARIRKELPPGTLDEPRKSDIGNWTVCDFNQPFDYGFITQIIEKEQ